MAGILLYKSYNSAMVEANEYENMTCVEKDCQNYIKQVRRLQVGLGDAIAIQFYFSKMQVWCSGFYFSIDVDEKLRLKNVFWAYNGVGNFTKSSVMFSHLILRTSLISTICHSLFLLA